MADINIEPSELGLELALEQFRLPDDVAAGLGDLYGTTPPDTAAAWVEMLRDRKHESDGEPPSVADLCTTDDGAHAFVGEDRSQSYICVLDPLVVPFLTDMPGTVRSTTPERGTTVEITLGPAGVEYSHPDAVVSLGVADEVDCASCTSIEETYEHTCPYIHVFEDEAEYETWAAETDAATTSVPVETGVALAGGLAENLFGLAS
ncbi:organomercurial lyase [Haloarcula salinisoli]|uniref:Alkylmercury lyase family protein n=1 Tax=Haloarcula salinisoli TaxID=2487746 RepID=A0A8J8C6Q7_9EURY|nr:organomercurial lyase [Halomicroarcula salinisoli]MBX0302546.1 alkylmercury lyase family protein [Halomicroarcula salinisoli]